MQSIGFDMVLPGKGGTSRTLHSCAQLHWDNACEANARFLSKQMRDVAARHPLPYVVGVKTFGGVPRVEEEHGR